MVTCMSGMHRLSAPGLESVPGISDTLLPKPDPTLALSSQKPGGKRTGLLFAPVELCWQGHLNTWMNFVPSVCLPLTADIRCLLLVEILLEKSGSGFREHVCISGSVSMVCMLVWMWAHNTVHVCMCL